MVTPDILNVMFLSKGQEWGDAEPKPIKSLSVEEEVGRLWLAGDPCVGQQGWLFIILQL